MSTPNTYLGLRTPTPGPPALHTLIRDWAKGNLLLGPLNLTACSLLDAGVLYTNS